MRKKYTCRLSPVSIYDIGCYENWLADQSARGLFFQSAKKKGQLGWPELARFEKGQPERRRYRLEPARSDADGPPVEEQELYEEMGWRFAGALRGLFWVFEAPDRADIPEPHTDPAALGELYERVSGKLKPGRMAAAWFPCVLMLLLEVFWMSKNTAAVFLTGSASYVVGILLFILLQNFILFRHHFKPMQRLREQLARGEAIDHNAPYRRDARAYLLQNAVMLTFAAALITAQFYGLSVYRYEELFAVENLPVPLLSELEGSSFTYDETEWFRGRAYPNYVRSSWTVLTPGQIFVRQSGKAGGEGCSLRTGYYQVCFAALAQPLFESVLEDFQRERRLYAPYEDITLRSLNEVERAGFDEAVLFRCADDETLIARRGRVVLHADYTGPQALTEFVPQFFASLQAGT